MMSCGYSGLVVTYRLRDWADFSGQGTNSTYASPYLGVKMGTGGSVYSQWAMTATGNLYKRLTCISKIRG